MHHNNNLKNYILIHLDEKFVDIQNIEKDLTNSIKYLSKKTNKRIIITSFNNEHEYYKNLKIKKINFRDMNNKKELIDKILIIEKYSNYRFLLFFKKCPC